MLTTFYFFVVYLLILYWLFVDQQAQPVPVPASAPTYELASNLVVPKPMPKLEAIATVAPVAISPAHKMPPLRKLKKLAVGKGIKGYQNMTQANLYAALKEQGLIP